MNKHMNELDYIKNKQNNNVYNVMGTKNLTKHKWGEVWKGYIHTVGFLHLYSIHDSASFATD